MKKSLLLFFPLIFLQQVFPQLNGVQKLIVTVTDAWNSNTATVYLFDRSKDSWKKQQQEFTVSIGENGLGWGTGLHPQQQGEHVKQEGDKRSPAGIFELESILYGLSSSAPEGVRVPYRQITSDTRCIDDTASVLYNKIIEEGGVQKDWNSAEEMGKVDPDYTYVLAVRNNAGAVKGKGSCIFFHINNVPTSGCTALDEQDMLTLLHWLDPKRKTAVVQLPHEEYHRFRRAWNLPHLQNN